MSETVKRAHVKDLTDAYDAVVEAVRFPDGVKPRPDTSALASRLVKKVTLASLRDCVRQMENRFSNNCNCLVNTNCCQTCQAVTCQSVYCQSQYCQSCQSAVCQSCQSCQSSGNCDCNVSDSH